MMKKRRSKTKTIQASGLRFVVRRARPGGLWEAVYLKKTGSAMWTSGYSGVGGLEWIRRIIDHEATAILPSVLLSRKV